MLIPISQMILMDNHRSPILVDLDYFNIHDMHVHTLQFTFCIAIIRDNPLNFNAYRYALVVANLQISRV